jgi:glutathione S-transferase
MSVKLYHFPASLCSQKVRLTLEEKGVEWTSHVVDIGPTMENYEPWYMRINPNGVVPTLDHDGHIVCDSARIVRYIDEQFEGHKLEPTDPDTHRAVEAWIDLQDHYPMREFSYGNTGGVLGLVMRRLALPKRRRVLERRKSEDPELADRYQARLDDLSEWTETITKSETMAALVSRMDDMLDRLQDRLADHEWLAGDAYTLADVVWTVLLARLKMLGFNDRFEGEARPAIAAYYARMKARPSFAKAGLVEVGASVYMRRLLWRKLTGQAMS